MRKETTDFVYHSVSDVLKRTSKGFLLTPEQFPVSEWKTPNADFLKKAAEQAPQLTPEDGGDGDIYIAVGRKDGRILAHSACKGRAAACYLFNAHVSDDDWGYPAVVDYNRGSGARSQFIGEMIIGLSAQWHSVV